MSFKTFRAFRGGAALAGLASLLGVLLSACVSAPAPASGPSESEVLAVLRASFSANASAGLDRLEQSELQRVCSRHPDGNLPAAQAEPLQAAALAGVRYPDDGVFLGDWKRGERIAQSGRGLQSSDAPGAEAGANCYACHQLRADELSYGNIGPSLLNYGKIRGDSPEMLRYTWAKIWNSHAYNACSQMPRFGDAAILTPAQIRDVMALLFDRTSPVNR